MITSTERDLLTTKGFINYYFNQLKDSNTCKDAYEKTEKVYKKVFSRNKYSCYDTFKSVLSRYVKNKKR